MSPDLPEKVLDISFDDPNERKPSEADDGEEEEFERYLFFVVGDQRLAVDVDDVKTIIEFPETVTRVPRSPPAIDGVTDIRGEITAVIDPRVHFPTDEEPPEAQRLLVFDRPADRQAAAMRVDVVHGVDAIPEGDVLDREAVESSEFSGDALEHPLVVGLIERERVYAPDPETDAPAPPDDQSAIPAATGGETNDSFVALFDGDDPGNSFDGGESTNPFERDDSADRDNSANPFDRDRSNESTTTSGPGKGTVVVEATPLVDVDRLLLASGGTSSRTPVESA